MEIGLMSKKYNSNLLALASLDDTDMNYHSHDTTRFILILCLTLMMIVASTGALGQSRQPLMPGDLQQHTYHFDIDANRPVGDGAKMLIEELRKNQFVILGEYHGSLRISEFTRMVIPILANAGCRTFALEVGPVSAEILSELSVRPEQTAARLRDLNSRNLVEDRGRVYTPIPFFSYIEDADFLAEARTRNWRLIGLDQEGSFAHSVLIDRMFRALDRRSRTELRPVYEKAIAAVKAAYKGSQNDGPSKYEAIMDSVDVNELLNRASAANPANRRIADAVRFTNEVFYMNDSRVRQYYDANAKRINYMKRNLSEQFSRLNFDVKKEKLLLKMGAVHTGRGFSPLSLFEIGNTLSELAELNGNRSLHIEFGSRFYTEGGKEVDGLADEKGFPYRYKALLQMSRRDKWTVIDLRPLRNAVFYARRYELDPVVLEIFKNHDLYIIPPTDRDSTPNYDRKL